MLFGELVGMASELNDTGGSAGDSCSLDGVLEHQGLARNKTGIAENPLI